MECRQYIRCDLSINHIPCCDCSINSCAVLLSSCSSLISRSSVSLHIQLLPTISRMKSTLIITALTAMVAAQGLTDIPTCSLKCLTTAITGLGCGLLNFNCSCQKSSELTPVVTPCVQSACSDPADQSKTLEVLSGICAAAGFPVEAPAPPASPTIDVTSEHPGISLSPHYRL